MIAAVRPDSWNLPLLAHVAGAMVLVGALVLVAAMGSRNSGGFAIRIDSVRVANGTARAWVTERSPGSSCVVTGAITEPTDAVVIPRVAAVEWSERAQVVPCGP